MKKSNLVFDVISVSIPLIFIVIIYMLMGDFKNDDGTYRHISILELTHRLISGLIGSMVFIVVLILSIFTGYPQLFDSAKKAGVYFSGSDVVGVITLTVMLMIVGCIVGWHIFPSLRNWSDRHSQEVINSIIDKATGRAANQDNAKQSKESQDKNSQ